VAEAWQLIGAEMEAQSDVHRAFANSLTEEVVRPLKTFVDKQHRVRKQVEGGVDKTGKKKFLSAEPTGVGRFLLRGYI